jgi:hypothetical protein
MSRPKHGSGGPLLHGIKQPALVRWGWAARVNPWMTPTAAAGGGGLDLG